MALDERLGINSKLYYASGGTWDSETWTEVGTIESLTPNLSWRMAPGGYRGIGVDAMSKTTASLSISGRIKVNENNSAYLAFVAFALIRTPVNLLALNGAKDSNGAAGWKGYFHVTGFSEPQGMGDAVYRDFTLGIATASESTPFKSAIVTGGVPVYTSFALPL